MNPESVFCPNIECPARGQQAKGNIGIHSQADARYICDACGQTFSATKGTIFYRLRTDAATVMLVIVLLSYGCPVPAIVKAFGFDERTVKSWWARAGAHCEAVHEHVVASEQLDLQQVQADEIKAKLQGYSVWMAMAMMVGTRLWLGGVISEHRDKVLIETLATKIAGMALCRPLLLAVDGLASYVGAFQKAFRSPLPRGGQPGRPKMVAWANINIVQVVKRRTAGALDIQRRIAQGTMTQVKQLITLSQGRGVINTAYIERLNATFRQRLAILARRTRCPARQIATLTHGMFIVGCFYNFCDTHDSLRQRLWLTNQRYRWVHRTPAMAAGISDHIWTPDELFGFKVPPAPWSPPQRRGRPSLEVLKLIERWCQ